MYPELLKDEGKTKEQLLKEYKVLRAQLAVLEEEKTARFRAEEELKNTKLFLESVIDNIPDLIFVKNAKTLNFERYNKVWEELLGCKTEELAGKNDYDFFPKEQADFFRQKDRETLKNKNLVDIPEEPIKTKKGTRILHTKKIPILDEKGNPKYLLGIAEDITEQKRREKELSDFLENATLGLHWVGPDGIILWANQAELDLLGFKREEYIGHHIAEFHVNKEVIDDLLNRLAANETLHNYEARLLCKDGSIKYVLIDSNVYWEDGEFIHTRCFTRDITDRKLAEEKLKALNDSLEQRIQERTEELVKFNKELHVKIKAHQHALDVMKEQEASFRLMFTNNPNPMLIFDPETLKILDVNQVLVTNYGYSRDELLSIKLTDIRPKEDIPRLLKEVKKERKEYKEAGEWRHCYKNGQIIDVEITSHTLTLGGKKAVLVLAKDITKRKKTEIKLQQEEAKYRSLIEQIPVITFLAKPEVDTGMIYISPQVESILGFTQKEWTTNPMLWSKQLHPEDRDQALKHYLKNITSSDSFTYSYRIFSKDGQIHWIEERVRVIKDELNKPFLVQGIFIDITEIKAKEEIEAQLSAIVKYSPDAIIGTTLDGIIYSWNPGAERLYGYPASEAIGKSIKLVIPVEHQKEIVKIIEKIKCGEEIEQYEAIRLRRDGKLINVSVDLSPIKNDSGTITGISAIVRDITERKNLQAELEQARQRAQQDKEIQLLEELVNSPAKSDVTSQLFGLVPLQKSVPGIFNNLVNRYEELVDLAIAKESNNIKHILSEELRFMGEELFTLKASASDAMDIHSKVMRRKTKELPSAKAQACTEKARFMVLELLGYLISYYRKNSLLPKNGNGNKVQIKA